MKIPPCSTCGKPSAIRQAYADLHLCPGCFVWQFEKRFQRAVREFSMIRKGDRIAVGLSGGKDSVVMLHLLSALRKKVPFILFAVAIDEGIDGYRDKTLPVAKRECRKLKIPLKVLSFKKELGYTLDAIMKEKNKAACSWCGVFRRHLLNKGALLVKANKIAIGHNLDDTAQTVLMNLMRNEPMRLVRFLEPVSEDKRLVPRIRPLLRIPEKEVAAYAAIKGMEIVHIECPYSHFSFRQHIKEHLNDTEQIYPGSKIRILNSFIEMEKWMRKGMGAQEFHFINCKKCHEPSSSDLCMKCRMLGELGSPKTRKK